MPANLAEQSDEALQSRGRLLPLPSSCVLQVCGMSVFLSALSYPLSRYWYNRNWRKINENELFEQKMLRYGGQLQITRSGNLQTAEWPHAAMLQKKPSVNMGTL